ncbi:hypothetical protein HH303_00555 [Rhodospirillaceae bacterium KN72]|uniref:HPt domain-containing protein n=1 Tax=Pacificispira spongiicola TaxID=2729598 RepID=A0A7Y0DWK9_9PROT|nr:hypothetical protein [Pacificispira spongiicola]NMM42947.1 hypothetical protein [Pacificispira spongiicola]
MGKNAKDPSEDTAPSESVDDDIASFSPIPSFVGRPEKSERVASAEAAIRKMTEDFPVWALEDIGKLDAHLREATPTSGNGKAALSEAFKIVHDMRGQGGSFGYPLITRISGSFCRFLEAVEDVTPQVLAISNAHAKALRTILENRISGNGGDMGDKIASGLENATAKYLANQ